MRFKKFASFSVTNKPIKLSFVNNSTSSGRDKYAFELSITRFNVLDSSASHSSGAYSQVQCKSNISDTLSHCTIVRTKL